MKKALLLMFSGIISIATGCGQQNQVQDSFGALQNQQINISSSKKLRDVKAPIIKLTEYDLKGIFKLDNSSNVYRERVLNTAIRSLDSDIIAFQEVDSPVAFKKFADKYLSDMKYNFYTRDNQTLGKINMVILSKFTISNLESINFKKNDISPITAPTKSVMRMKIQVTPDYSFTLLSTFINPSTLANYTLAQRSKDIMDVKLFLKAFQKANFGEKFTVVGNLGGNPDSPDLQTILDPRSSELSLHDAVSEDIGVNEDSSTSHTTKRPMRSDYVLISAGMYDEYITKSVVISRDAVGSNDKTFNDASDHYPISIKFDLSLANQNPIHSR
ncbi:MAG: endonuclease/exonuclease/phosphatase family protein [Candidatus Sericytochromatia bacterium]|nr:endonuclease/exonuclease/phosphatase family protein [Candidatus Sericytochromatia bacterium]